MEDSVNLWSQPLLPSSSFLFFVLLGCGGRKGREERSKQFAGGLHTQLLQFLLKRCTVSYAREMTRGNAGWGGGHMHLGPSLTRPGL